MTRSRGQFDTRHDDADRDRSGDGTLGEVRDLVTFHRVEFLLTCWLVLGGVLVPLLFGLGAVAFEAGGSVPEPVASLFWLAVLLALPLLAVVLLVHAVVDAGRVGFGDGEVRGFGAIALRGLQTASALVFAWGVYVLFEETAPASAEFDPAALLSAFMLVVGFAGMVAFVGVDGLVRLARGTW